MGIRKELNPFLKNTIYGEYGAFGNFDHLWPVSGTENHYYVYIKGLKNSVWEQKDIKYMEMLQKLGNEYGIVLILDPDIFKEPKID